MYSKITSVSIRIDIRFVNFTPCLIVVLLPIYQRFFPHDSCVFVPCSTLFICCRSRNEARSTDLNRYACSLCYEALSPHVFSKSLQKVGILVSLSSPSAGYTDH